MKNGTIVIDGVRFHADRPARKTKDTKVVLTQFQRVERVGTVDFNAHVC